MMAIINKNTQILAKCKTAAAGAVTHAINALLRDINKACLDTETFGSDIWLVETTEMERECYRITVHTDKITIEAADVLGFIYGIYAVSEGVLGILPFWFWMDQSITPKTGYEVADGTVIESKPFAVRFRGWFFNDEVLLHKWSVNGDSRLPWQMGFEALLRCGGNMVIPGTDRNGRLYHDLAVSMGLFVTHHHAEPLGAEMFARAYPGVNASYDEHPKMFERLWSEAIARQQGENIVWTLAFRGQGDAPFWNDDPKYETPNARGELLSKLIRKQHDMVRSACPDAVCCTNLYGEVMELNEQGCLDLPNDIIKIWADNGYGKMVSRRQGNHNPRVPALPPTDDVGPNGIYYHVSFYDLQAANHITMLPNSADFVRNELLQVINSGATDYWLINCSNVRPHVYLLDMIARMWRDGDVNVNVHREKFAESYYGIENADAVSRAIEDYARCAVQYGPNEDDRAGEQFTNHVARMLISQYMKDGKSKADDLVWCADMPTLEEQVLWYSGKCAQGKESYKQYLLECENVHASMIGDDSRGLFADTIMLQATIHYHCYAGAGNVCECLTRALKGDYKSAFYYAGLARKEYLATNAAMRESEHGKWTGYYANECLTDIKQTAWVLTGLMSYLRNLGDGPHFYAWQREFLYSEKDRKVMLVMNMENHITDDELWVMMEAQHGCLKE